MKFKLHSVLVYLAVVLSETRSDASFPDADSKDFAQTVLKAGEEHYKLTTSYSQVPVYGKCWTKPLESLPVACGNLTEDAHKWLALTFANCFLIQSRQKPHPCVEPAQSNVSLCLEMGMDDRVFATYNNFYIHTHNMCYYLKSQVWQEETRKTVFRLMDASQRVVTNMESQLEIQKKIRHTQEEALQNGLELRREMDMTIVKSKESLQEMLDEIRRSSGQQMAIFDEIAHHIIKLRALFFGEFVGVYTALYYFFIVIVSYLLTSCKRLEGARLWLYMVFTLSFVAEYLAANWNTEETMKMFSDQAQAMVYARVWFIRKTAVVAGLIVTVICGWRFRDYIDIVCELQKDNLQTRKEILSLIQSIRQESPNKADSQHWNETVDEPKTSFIQSTPIKLSTRSTPNPITDEAIPVPEKARSPYNLRERSRSPSVSTTPIKESPMEFVKQVHKSAEKSLKNSIWMRKQLRSAKSALKYDISTMNFSDED